MDTGMNAMLFMFSGTSHTFNCRGTGKPLQIRGKQKCNV